MYKACYLLDTEKLNKTTALEALLDQERLQKYAQMKTEQGARQSLGAGLLLQLAAGEFLLERRREGNGTAGRETEGNGEQGFPVCFHFLDADTLQKRMHGAGYSWPLDLRYSYHEAGKPYFANLPLFFNLSHSGRFILCACSGREIGADIQKMTGVKWKSLSKRFFAKEETSRLEKLPEEEARDVFFRLWTKKEAYGKLLGVGVLKALSVPLLEETDELSWQQGHIAAGNGERYCYAICEKRPTGGASSNEQCRAWDGQERHERIP